MGLRFLCMSGGIKILDAPIGNQHFIEEHLKQFSSKIEDDLSLLQPGPLQRQLAVQRVSSRSFYALACRPQRIPFGGDAAGEVSAGPNASIRLFVDFGADVCDPRVALIVRSQGSEFLKPCKLWQRWTRFWATEPDMSNAIPGSQGRSSLLGRKADGWLLGRIRTPAPPPSTSESSAASIAQP